jgi:hypothetical protein
MVKCCALLALLALPSFCLANPNWERERAAKALQDAGVVPVAVWPGYDETMARARKMTDVVAGVVVARQATDLVTHAQLAAKAGMFFCVAEDNDTRVPIGITHILMVPKGPPPAAPKPEPEPEAEKPAPKKPAAKPAETSQSSDGWNYDARTGTRWRYVTAPSAPFYGGGYAAPSYGYGYAPSYGGYGGYRSYGGGGYSGGYSGGASSAGSC